MEQDTNTTEEIKQQIKTLLSGRGRGDLEDRLSEYKEINMVLGGD